MSERNLPRPWGASSEDSPAAPEKRKNVGGLPLDDLPRQPTAGELRARAQLDAELAAATRAVQEPPADPRRIAIRAEGKQITNRRKARRAEIGRLTILAVGGDKGARAAIDGEHAADQVDLLRLHDLAAALEALDQQFADEQEAEEAARAQRTLGEARDYARLGGLPASRSIDSLLIALAQDWSELTASVNGIDTRRTATGKAGVHLHSHIEPIDALLAAMWDACPDLARALRLTIGPGMPLEDWFEMAFRALLDPAEDHTNDESKR